MTFKPLVSLARGALDPTRAALCVPLLARGREPLLAGARAAILLRPDILEWRVDAFGDLSTSSAETALLAAAIDLRALIGSLPCILTLRAQREGGLADHLTDVRRAELLTLLAPALQPDFIDVELTMAADLRRQIRELCNRSGARLILSSHDFAQTPDLPQLMASFRAAQEQGADVAKLAAMPKDFSDVLRLMTATQQASVALTIPVIGISMGELGLPSRVFAGECGSALTFVVGTQGSAPGQLSVDAYRKLSVILRPAFNCDPPAAS